MLRLIKVHLRATILGLLIACVAVNALVLLQLFKLSFFGRHVKVYVVPAHVDLFLFGEVVVYDTGSHIVLHLGSLIYDRQA